MAPAVDAPKLPFAHTVPQTPLQREAFVDACTRWLVREPDSGETRAAAFADRTRSFVDLEAAEAAAPGAGATATRTAYTHAELRAQHAIGRCAMCAGTKDLRPVVANPFAQRCVWIVCASCR